jgi:hypothetical protein
MVLFSLRFAFQYMYLVPARLFVAFVRSPAERSRLLAEDEKTRRDRRICISATDHNTQLSNARRPKTSTRPGVSKYSYYVCTVWSTCPAEAQASAVECRLPVRVWPVGPLANRTHCLALPLYHLAETHRGRSPTH